MELLSEEISEQNTKIANDEKNRSLGPLQAIAHPVSSRYTYMEEPPVTKPSTPPTVQITVPTSPVLPQTLYTQNTLLFYCVVAFIAGFMITELTGPKNKQSVVPYRGVSSKCREVLDHITRFI